jgi:ESCRT-I complex subunit TSG101
VVGSYYWACFSNKHLLFFDRLLNAYAEEAATEDAIYYMGEALRSGVIDLEVFMKYVRQLSRKQFMLRALMQKCRQKAGLAG